MKRFTDKLSLVGNHSAVFCSFNRRYAPRYYIGIDRHPFTHKANGVTDESIRIFIENVLWQSFHGDNSARLTSCIPHTGANASPAAQNNDRWLRSLTFTVSFAPSLSSFRYVLIHWLTLFIEHCVHGDQSGTCFDRIDEVLSVFPNHVITLPLLEVIVRRMIQIISTAPDITSSERLHSGIVRSILRPIIYRLEKRDSTFANSTNASLRYGMFDLKSRLIAAPCLFLHLWSSVYANPRHRFPMPFPTLHHLMESLLQANASLYEKLYYSKFRTTLMGDAKKKEPCQELWITTLQLCSISSLTGRVSQGQSDTMSLYYHQKSDKAQNAAWVGYYMLRIINIWHSTEFPNMSSAYSVNNWETALQLSKELLWNLSPYSVFRFYFLAETLPFLPAEMWTKSLRVFLPESTTQQSDWEIACEFLDRIEKISPPQSCALCENGLVNVRNQRGMKLPLIADFDLLRSSLRHFVLIQRHGRLSHGNVESVTLLPTIRSHQRMGESSRRDDAVNSPGHIDQTPPSLLTLPPAVHPNIWISALSIVTCAKQRHSTWQQVIALLSQHVKTFGMHANSQAAVLSLLRQDEGKWENSSCSDSPLVTRSEENQNSLICSKPELISQTRNVHWLCSCIKRYKLPCTIPDSLQQRDHRKMTSSFHMIEILYFLTQSMLRHSGISTGSSLKKMALIMLRMSIQASLSEQVGIVRGKKSISIVLSSVIALMQSQSTHIPCNWRFGLRLLVSLNNARELKSWTEEFQPHDVVKRSMQQMAKKCLSIGLWQAAIAYTLLFQKCVRSIKNPSQDSKGIPVITSVRYLLSIADHLILRHSVERTLREYLERKSRTDNVLPGSSWEIVLQASKFILRPLRKVERIIITPSSAKVVPTQYYRFDPCCLLRWAQSNVPDHGTYFRILMNLSPIHCGELRPMDYLVQYPSKFESWRVTFNSERLTSPTQSQKDFASQHFFLTVQRCIAHPRLWQQAFAMLLQAVKIRPWQNFADDGHENENYWNYTDSVFRILGPRGPDIKSYIMKDATCALHMKMPTFSPFCQTILRLCTVHSAEMLCDSIIPVFLPLLAPSVVSVAFCDSLLHILTTTVIRHARSRDGSRILQELILICVQNLPHRFGYSLTNRARSSIRQAIEHVNGSKKFGKPFTFFETNISLYSVSKSSYQPYRWGEIVRQFSIKLRNLKFLPEIDKRQRLGKPLLTKLVELLFPSLQLNLAMPPSSTLCLMYDYLVICHELPKDVISYFVLLLSIGFQSNRRNIDTTSLERGTDEEIKEAHRKIQEILRLQKDIELMYHVKSMFFSFQRKRVEVDSLEGLMVNLRVDNSNRVKHGGHIIATDTQQERMLTRRSGPLRISVEKLMEVSWWCYSNRSSFFEYSHSMNPTPQRLPHSFVMTASIETLVQLTFSVTSKRTQDVRRIGLSRILKRQNMNESRNTGSVRLEKEIFACFCEIVRRRDDILQPIKETVSPTKMEEPFKFDSSVALCYAMISDQLCWKVLLNTIFNGNVPKWRESLSKAQLLRIDMGE